MPNKSSPKSAKPYPKSPVRGLYLRGKSWYYDIRYRGKRYMECVGPVSRRQAEQYLIQKKSDLVFQHFGLKTSLRQINLEDFINNHYLPYAQARFKSKTLRVNKTTIHYLLKLWANKPLQAITKHEIEAFQ
jgi:hypothetical protein